MVAHWNWLEQLSELSRCYIPVAIVTISGFKGSAPRGLGAKMLVTENIFFGTIGGGRLEQMAIDSARESLKLFEPRELTVVLGPEAGQCCGGSVNLLIEIHGTAKKVYIFGAGHVGQAVSKILVGTPYIPVLIDQRSDWLAQANHLAENQKWPFAPRDSFKKLEIPARSSILVMTHSHDLDLEVLCLSLEHEKEAQQHFSYLGVIGSLTKWKKFQQRLQARNYSEADISRIRSPIGIYVGGKSPQEVAISVAAELLQNHYGIGARPS